MSKLPHFLNFKTSNIRHVSNLITAFHKNYRLYQMQCMHPYKMYKQGLVIKSFIYSRHICRYVCHIVGILSLFNWNIKLYLAILKKIQNWPNLQSLVMSDIFLIFLHILPDSSCSWCLLLLSSDSSHFLCLFSFLTSDYPLIFFSHLGFCVYDRLYESLE